MNCSAGDSDGRTASSWVDLYWIPLGAGVGGAVVRFSGPVYEAATAAFAGRPACDLYHSALMIKIDGVRSVVEMAPVWVGRGDVGVVSDGAVGTPRLGRWSMFRYGVRRWTGGAIPDVAAAVGGASRITEDRDVVRLVFDLVPLVPTPTWGRDELGTGDMWNSNSLISWLMVKAGLDVAAVGPPAGGRAPGWDAGIEAARRALRP